MARHTRKSYIFDDEPIADLPPRRRAILGAAFEVLMERGYAGASTIEIATRAKVSKRELYAEFGNKNGILKTLIATTSARIQAALSVPDFADRQAFVAGLTAYGVTALTVLSHPAVVAMNRLAVAEAGGSSELGQIIDTGGREQNRLALEQLMTRAQGSGFVGEGDPDRMTGQFFSLLFGDIPLRLMLGVTTAPDAQEVQKRAEAATQAVLILYPTPNQRT